MKVWTIEVEDVRLSMMEAVDVKLLMMVVVDGKPSMAKYLE